MEGDEMIHSTESNKDSSNIENEGSTSTLEIIKETCSNDENKGNDSTLETIRETYGNDESKDNDSTLDIISKIYGIEEKCPSPRVESKKLQNIENYHNNEDSNEEKVKNIALISPEVDCENDCKKQLVEKSMQPNPTLESLAPNTNNLCGWF